MKRKILISSYLMFVFIIILACNMPFSSNKYQETAQAEITSIVPSLEVLPEKIETEAGLDLSQAATLLAKTAESIAPKEIIETPVPPVETSVPNPNHSKTPGDPGKASVIVSDFNSQPLANEKRTNGDYFDTNLLERPFNDQMTYRGDVDIIKAEIVADQDFYYFTIFLSALSDPLAANDNYGVELDIDIDGRGDYLLWTGAPVSNQWEISQAALYADADGDVGGKTPLKSDAPSSGTGYEKLLSSSQNPIDPDAIWSRKNPTNPNAIQIAVKIESVNNPKSFMWGAWADGLIKAPNMFDYHDVFTLQNAGVPYKDDKNYPLKSVHTIDNTCRGMFGRQFTGIEPGLCSDWTKPIQTLVPTNSLPKITPPANLPNIP